jgi:pimeloyl-ACP methyl ester carboxylesterase
MVEPAANAERLHKALQNSSLRIVQDAGHKLHHTHPQAVLRALDMVSRRRR